jgi:hypothetical protein
MKDASEYAPFRSLVERSITAWNSLNYVGTIGDKAGVFRRHTETLRRLDSVDTLLGTGVHQFWFFQLRESFFRQNGMTKWHPGRLDEYILLPIDYGFVNNRDCFFVSHYWHTREHPDPDGRDLHLFRGDLVQQEWSYIWVDWTCMPQAPRSQVQQGYFQRMLRFIPALLRDCAFEWRFPAFEPRAWILFEVAEFVLTHEKHAVTADIKPFVAHTIEMLKEGVRPIISKHRYACTNGSDLDFVIGWLELLVIVATIVPKITDRQQVLDWVDKSFVGRCQCAELGIDIDKAVGVVSHNGKTYQFTPVFRS